MRLALPLTAAAALLLLSSAAFAAPVPQPGAGDSDYSTVGGHAHSAIGAHAVTGAVVTGGAAAGAAGLSKLFGNGSVGQHVDIAHAPEISSKGSLGGLVLLIGGLLIFSGRQRARA